MPPSRVSPSGDETDDRSACHRRLERLLHPIADRSSIGRVHPADTLPFLPKAVVCWRKETFAFGIAGKRADIKFEMKLRIEQVEDLLGRCPLISQAR